jgi:hypothetical protein
MPSAAMQSQFQDIYQRANDPQLASLRTEVRDGSFAARLTIPAQASGPCHVRIAVNGARSFAMGWADVEILGSSAARPPANSRK